MKEFEKWKKAFYRENDPLPTHSVEEAWRQAFQTIRNEIKRLRGTRRAISILEVVAFINEELGNHNEKF